ncbi:uncharacterized protein BP01DRAFT_36406 [Aspergillus saccharolyticus JOP 1030-1]|uniref:Uncharacterized protein n=1 Tax=Aspergillus saccharolyticus JOP 1030-1 TaxID=1450539 RepID=A0A318ZF01_9EURO|nr:hypothetical protein BP01DRAFT_36406 [Aspergillus saccharolyticus JOP 1030-1]PYH45675.1 hypothetical protein BP01DRAFT_36406 [Aspergillus saccharolyticus JOP 1030-1]
MTRSVNRLAANEVSVNSHLSTPWRCIDHQFSDRARPSGRSSARSVTALVESLVVARRLHNGCVHLKRVLSYFLVTVAKLVFCTRLGLFLFLLFLPSSLGRVRPSPSALRFRAHPSNTSV